jgi:hypothetical protein
MSAHRPGARWNARSWHCVTDGPQARHAGLCAPRGKLGVDGDHLRLLRRAGG